MFGFRMITCERKVKLELDVVCKCVLGVSRSSSIMMIFRQFLPELFPVPNRFPDDNMQMKSRIEARCGMYIYVSNEYLGRV